MPSLVAPAQTSHPAETAREATTILGRGCEFEGKLTFEGTVRIDGKLRGEIFSEDVLIVGEGAEIHAEIDVGLIVIEGSVQGNIVAKRGIELHAPARVRGNLLTPSLQIEKGVIFQGQCQMEGNKMDPKMALPSPPPPMPRPNV